MSEAVLEQRPLPVGGVGRLGVGWWGVLSAIITEACLFGYLLFGYFYFAVQLGGNWMPRQPPDFRFSLPALLVLIASSAAIAWAARGVTLGRRGRLLGGLLITLLLGLIFVLLQLLEWRSKPFTMRSGAYGSVFFTITGWHLAHEIAGVLALVMVTIWSALGYFDRRRHVPVLIVAAYWHFVVAVEVAVFVALYITPYLA